MGDYQSKKEKKQEKKKVKIPNSMGTRKEGKSKESKDTNTLVKLLGLALIILLIYFVFFSGTFNQVGFIEDIYNGAKNFVQKMGEWFNPDEHVIISESGIYFH